MNSEILYPFGIPVKILKIFGLWQIKSSSRHKIAFTVILHFLLFVTFFFLQLFYIFNFESHEDFASAMTLLPSSIGLLIKAINLLYYNDEIILLMKVIMETVESERLVKIEKRMERIESIFRLFLVSAIFPCILTVIVPFIHHKLPYPVWFPYNYNESEGLFWVSAGYVLINIICYSGVIISLDILPIIFMNFIIGMLQSLCFRLEFPELKAVKVMESASTSAQNNTTLIRDEKAELVKLILFQLKICEILKKVEKCFSNVLMSQGLASAVILCTTSLSLTVVSFNFYHFRLNQFDKQ